jgi:hypothetical protein
MLLLLQTLHLTPQQKKKPAFYGQGFSLVRDENGYHRALRHDLPS